MTPPASPTAAPLSAAPSSPARPENAEDNGSSFAGTLDSAREAGSGNTAPQAEAGHARTAEKSTLKPLAHEDKTDKDKDKSLDKKQDASAPAAMLALLTLGQGREANAKAASSGTPETVKSKAFDGQLVRLPGSENPDSPHGSGNAKKLHGGASSEDDGKSATFGTKTTQHAHEAGAVESALQDGADKTGMRQELAKLLGSVNRPTRASLQDGSGRHNAGNPLLGMGTATLSGFTANAAPSVMRSVSVPVGHPQWSQAMAQAIVESSSADGGRLRLQLNPANMGPVDIDLDVDHDHAKLQIVATQPATRLALQQAIPQLTALMAGEGLQLTHADVSAGNSGHQGDTDESDASPTAAIGDSPTAQPARARPRPLRNGLVDDYA